MMKIPRKEDFISNSLKIHKYNVVKIIPNKL